MSNLAIEVEAVLKRVDDTLDTARLGLKDLLDTTRSRRMSGLRNLIAFGRSVTFVLQNLRSVVPPGEFDSWYEPHQQSLKADPLMPYFVDARNELEKQGKLSVVTSSHIRSFSSDDIKKFGRPPMGATVFFIGDQLGGSGWEVELADGSKEKYYVELPSSIGAVKQHFSNLPEAMSPELKGATIEELAERYIARMTVLGAAARAHFLGPPPSPVARQRPTYLKRVK
ncbi:MAG: hypothetical protein JWR22_898 [Herminiimonas sp.]|nr:hypothetical protein [Herminiimonas sp.]